MDREGQDCALAPTQDDVHDARVPQEVLDDFVRPRVLELGGDAPKGVSDGHHALDGLLELQISWGGLAPRGLSLYATSAWERTCSRLASHSVSSRPFSARKASIFALRASSRASSSSSALRELFERGKGSSLMAPDLA